MTRNRIFQVLMFAALAIWFAACSGRPVELIGLTEKARQEAAAEHADQFAIDDWGAGEESWQEATAKLNEEKWGDAQKLLLNAKSKFILARDRAKEKRERAIAEIKSTRDRANKRLVTLKEDPGAARLTAARRKELDTLAKQYEASLARVPELIEKAEYQNALILAQQTDRDIWQAQQDFFKK
jgi:DNA repair ATPase RecN